jgi:hypothetical protein
MLARQIGFLVVAGGPEFFDARLFYDSLFFRAPMIRWIIRVNAIAPAIPSRTRSDDVNSIPKIVII